MTAGLIFWMTAFAVALVVYIDGALRAGPWGWICLVLLALVFFSKPERSAR